MNKEPCGNVIKLKKLSGAEERPPIFLNDIQHFYILLTLIAAVISGSNRYRLQLRLGI